jgi:hypothetical protein
VETANKEQRAVAMLLIPLLMLPLLLQLEVTATPPQTPSSWSNSRPPVSQQVGKHCIERQSFAWTDIHELGTKTFHVYHH